MILLELKSYIKQHQRVSLDNIKHKFDISEDTVQGLLMPLIRQGHIVEVSTASCSSGHCSSGCQQTATEYQWLDRKLRPLSQAIEIISI